MKNSTLEALNRLAKWRNLLAGWQLGTRANSDPECAAVRDTRELLLLMRTELNALVGLLIAKGSFTEDEWNVALETEADQMSRDYERRFPGFKATNVGLEMSMPEAGETMKRMHFKP